jgi:CRISPR-associated endonuclease/helicase Cas3
MLDWIKKLSRRSGRKTSPTGSLEPLSQRADNPAYGLETDNRTLAQGSTARAGADSPGALAAEGGAQHGVRVRAGGPAHAGGGTRPPPAATRYLNTTLGVLSYAELAPHLATRVQALQSAIVRGEYDGRVLDEDLLLERHRRICADLIPDLAGRWRSYLAALRAADRNDWRPLMDIWRERFEESDIE